MPLALPAPTSAQPPQLLLSPRAKQPPELPPPSPPTPTKLRTPPPLPVNGARRSPWKRVKLLCHVLLWKSVSTTATRDNSSNSLVGRPAALAGRRAGERRMSVRLMSCRRRWLSVCPRGLTAAAGRRCVPLARLSGPLRPAVGAEALQTLLIGCSRTAPGRPNGGLA